MFLFQKDFFGLPVSNVTTGESSRLGTSCSIVLNCVPSAMTRSLAASLIFFGKAGLSAHLWLNKDYIFSHKEIKIANKANFLMIFCLRSNMDEWTGSTFMSVSAGKCCLQAVNTGSKLWPIEVQQEHTCTYSCHNIFPTCMSCITNIFTIFMSILTTATVW